MDKVELDFEFTINGAQAKAEADNLKASVSGAGFSAEEAAKRLISAFNPALGLLEQLENEARQLKTALKEATSGNELEAYRAKLAQVTELQTKLSKGLDESANKAKGSFSGLQNSINQITRELPAFTFSAQTGFLAISNNIPMLFDEIGRLKKQNDELSASGQKGVPVWKQLMTSLFSWNTLMSVGVTLLTIYGKEIGNFIIALFKGKEAINQALESLKNLNKALDGTEYKKAVTNVKELSINIDLAKKGLIDKKDVVDQYNSTIGKTTGQVKNLDEAEKALAKNAKAYVEMTLYKAAANLSLEEAAKSAIEAEKTRLKNLSEFKNSLGEQRVSSGGFGGGSGLFNAKEYQAETERIKKAREKRKNDAIKIDQDASDAQTKIAENFLAKAAKISTDNHFDFFGKADDKAKEAERLRKQDEAEMKKILDQRKGLMEKISDIDAEYLRKSYSKDEEELRALKEKFSKVRQLVEEFNKKNPKKAISLTDFDRTEGFAIEDLGYRQDTSKLKERFEREKKLYEDFEAFKTSFGEAKAKERFSKQIDTEVTYLQKRQADYAVTYAQGAVGGFRGAVTERLAVLKKALDAEADAQGKKQDELLKSLVSYQEQRTKLTETYNAQRASLNVADNANEIAELDKQYKEKLNVLDDGHIQQLSAYKALFDSIEQLSDQQAKKVVNDAKVLLKALVDAGLGGTDLLKKIAAKLKETEKAIGQNMPERLIRIAGQLDAIASSVSNIDAEFAKVLSTVGNVVGQLGNIRKGMDDFRSAGKKNDALGQLGAGLGILNAGISIFSSVFKLFDRSAQREAQASYARDMQAKQVDALNKSLERQVALINDVYGLDRILKYNEALKTAGENQAKFEEQLKGKYALSGNKELDDILTKINNGEQIIGGNLAFIKKNQALIDSLKLPVNSISDLTRLLDEGKLDANTANIVRNLIEAKKAAVDLANQLKAETVGASLDSIADQFINDLLDSTKTAGKSIEGIIRTSVLKGFKGELIKNQLQGFYDQFAEFSKDGLTSDEIAILNKSYADAFEAARKKISDLEKATGVSLGNDPSSGNGIAAKIQDAITESTGSEIVGSARASYEMNKQNVAATKENTAIGKDILSVQTASYETLKEQLLVQYNIETNTANTVAELQKAVTELKQININTKIQGSRAI